MSQIREPRCRWCAAEGRPGAFVNLLGHWFCEHLACMERQIAHAMPKAHEAPAGESPYVYVPTPAQVDLRESKAPNLLWGSGAGVAKSHGLRWDAYHWCKTIPNYEVLLMRRTFPELEETHLLAMAKDQHLVGATYKPGEKRLVWDNGSFIKAGHCQDPKDYTKLLSREYAHIVLDEGTTFDRTQILEISSRARTTNPFVRERAITIIGKDGLPFSTGGEFVRIGSNPGGPGHVFLRENFIDKNPDPVEFPEYLADEWAFMPGLLQDNPYLSPSYLRRLLQLEPERRDQLIDGDWTVFSGAFFGEFSMKKHVRSLEAA